MNHDRLNDYICKLKILSKLEPREKIIIHERSIEIVDYTTYNLARLKKAVKWENRWHMIVKLEAMYHDIDSIVDNLVNNPPNRTPEQDVLFALDRLRHDLDGSLQGLHNLILTYNTNKSATSRLETLYEDVKILSQKINKFFSKKSNKVDRKLYGVENVLEESKKVKQINEFDPTKAELQTSGDSTVNSKKPPLPPTSVLRTCEFEQFDNDDDTFSSESPIEDPHNSVRAYKEEGRLERPEEAEKEEIEDEEQEPDFGIHNIWKAQTTSQEKAFRNLYSDMVTSTDSITSSTTKAEKATAATAAATAAASAAATAAAAAAVAADTASIYTTDFMDSTVSETIPAQELPSSSKNNRRNRRNRKR